MSIPLLYLFVWLLSIPLGKKEIFIILAADTIVSCTEAVDELFQHTLGHECMDSYVNIIAMCVYMTIAYSALKKKLWNKQIFIILATDTIQSCIEAADKLFQHIFGHKSMEHVNAYFYIYIHVHCLFYSEKKAIFF